jgi:hypothetical protein
MSHKPNRSRALFNPTRPATPPAGKPAAAAQDRSTPRLMMDLILEAVRVSDARLNALATELLGRSGTQPVRRLVLAAINPRNGPQHRVRLLRAVRQIGVISDPVSYLDLCSLLVDRSAAVRVEAADLLAYLRDRGGTPADDEGQPPAGE